MSVNVIRRAALFARAAHAGQLRKETGDPYIIHPMRVAGRVTLLDYQLDGIDADDEMIVAGWLHDVREDSSVTREDILREFNWRVEEIVDGLTNVYTKEHYPQFNRKERKERELGRLSKLPNRVLAIKLIDRIDNLREIDPRNEFARVYAAESIEIAKVTEEGLPILTTELLRTIGAIRARF